MTVDQAIDRYSNNAEYELRNGNLHGYMEFRQLAEWLKDYKRLLEQEPCEDAVSRQSVLEIVNNPLNIRLDDIIKRLPPVTPRPKTGHWIRMKAYGKWGCSECNTVFRFTFKEHDYCPNCGAKMQESEESK